MNGLCPLIHAALGGGTTAEVADQLGEIRQSWNRYRQGERSPTAGKIADWCQRAGIAVTFRSTDGVVVSRNQGNGLITMWTTKPDGKIIEATYRMTVTPEPEGVATRESQ